MAVRPVYRFLPAAIVALSVPIRCRLYRSDTYVVASSQVQITSPISTQGFSYALLQQLDRDIPWKTRAETRPNPELTNNLRLLRGLLNSPAFAEDATLFASVVDDLIHHMPALADIPIEQFTREEFGHLEHLLKHAAGQETGLGEQLP